MRYLTCVLVTLFAATLFVSDSAFASPISFDCDVPADHYSSVSQEANGPLVISGMVKLVAARAGDNLPVAGARLVSSDGQDSAGFQLVANSSKPTRFDVVLNLNKNGELKRYSVSQIGIDSIVSFRLVIDAERVNLTVNKKTVEGDFIPLTGGKLMVFCSTAQFKFTEVVFGTNLSR